MAKRRSFGKTVLVTLISWAFLALWVWNVPPDGLLSEMGFFFLAFWALWLPLSVLFVSGRRGFMVTLGVLGTLAMKPLGVYGLLSVGAWWAIVVVLELWLSSR